MPGRLHVRLCHAFLVLNVFRLSQIVADLIHMHRQT